MQIVKSQTYFQPHHTRHNFIHILPPCITSRTKYSAKSWKSFGLAEIYNKNSHFMFSS